MPQQIRVHSKSETNSFSYFIFILHDQNAIRFSNFTFTVFVLLGYRDKCPQIKIKSITNKSVSYIFIP